MKEAAAEVWLIATIFLIALAFWAYHGKRSKTVMGILSVLAVISFIGWSFASARGWIEWRGE